jgi:predicted PurR-regulated permease PerM
VPPDSRRSAAEAVTWPVRVAAAWGWRLLVMAVAMYALVRVLSQVGLVMFAVIIALFLTAVLQPLERQLRRAVPRPASLAALLTLLCGVVVLGGIGYFVAWQISTHTTQLGKDISDVVTHTKRWLQNGPLHMNAADLDKLSADITHIVQSHESAVISGAISTVRAVTEGLAALLLILLVTFFLLRDGPIVWGWVVRLFPRAAHARLDHAGRAGWRTFGGYMRGQLLIALFHGVSITIVLLVLRIPLAAALGVLIFLGSFIPLVGLIVTGALAVAVALLDHGLLSAIVVAVAIVVLVQAEGHLLQPFIMSRSVHIHPLAVVLAVVAGTTLGGIPGALIAVPLAAFANTTVQAARAGPGQPVRPDDRPVEAHQVPGTSADVAK